MKVLTSTLAVWFLSLVFSFSALGQLPGFLIYDGVLKDDTGAVIQGPVNFTIEVYASGDPSPEESKCILYKENHNAVALSNEGHFSIKFGAGIAVHGGSLSTVLVNGPLFDCDGSGDYQTAAGESRFFRVTVDDGTDVATLSPDMEVGSVPTAMLADNAMMLNGKSDLDLIQVNQSAGNQLTQANVENVFSDTNFPILSNILTNGVGAGDIVSGAVDDTHIADVGLSKVSNDSTCTDGQIVKWDNTAGNFVCINAGGGGDMLAANDLSEVNDANARTNLGLGTAAVKNTGTANGNVVLLDATGLPAVDGSQLTNLTAGNVSGTLAVGNIPALSGSNITDLSINNADIAADAITTGKILDGTITAADIAAGVLDGSSSTTNVTFNSDSDGNSTGIIDFQVNGVTKMVVHESGSVGIGTNTPAVELDVVGDIATSGYIAMKSQGQAKFKDLDNSNHISLKAPTDVTADYVLTLPGDDGANGEVLSTDGSGVLDWVAVGTGDINEGGNSLAGNMTIGTNDSFDLIFETNNAAAMSIKANGDVGIGTSSPATELDVIGTTASSEFRADAGSAAGTTVNFGVAGTGFYGPATGSQIAISTGGTERFRVTNTGDVGIGTTAPSGKLDIEGGDVFIGNGTLDNPSAGDDLLVTGNLEIDGALYGDGSNLTGIVATSGGDIKAGGQTGAINIGSTDSTVTIDSNGFTGIHLNGATAAIGSVTIDAGLALDVSGKIGATEYCLDDGTGCITHATLNNKLDGGVNPGVLNLGSTDSPVTIDSNGFTGIHLNGATAAIGSVTIDAGLALDVSGKIGATEYCLDDGTGCITHATLNNKLDGGVNPGVLNLGSTDSPVTIDSNGFTGIHLNGATAAIGSVTIDAGLALDVSGKIGATEYCLDDGTGCITHATLNNKLDGGVNPGVLNLGSTDSPVTIDSNGFTGIHLNGATAAIGSVTIDAGLALDVSGKIGATEICQADGTGCIPTASLGGGPTVYDFGNLNADDTGAHFIDGANGEFQKVNLTGGSPGQSAMFQATAPTNLIPGQVYTLYVTNGAPEERAIEFNHAGYDFLDMAETKIHVKNGEFVTIQMVADTTTTLKYVSTSMRDSEEGPLDDRTGLSASGYTYNFSNTQDHRVRFEFTAGPGLVNINDPAADLIIGDIYEMIVENKAGGGDIDLDFGPKHEMGLGGVTTSYTLKDGDVAEFEFRAITVDTLELVESSLPRPLAIHDEVSFGGTNYRISGHIPTVRIDRTSGGDLTFDQPYGLVIGQMYRVIVERPTGGAMNLIFNGPGFDDQQGADLPNMPLNDGDVIELEFMAVQQNLLEKIEHGGKKYMSETELGNVIASMMGAPLNARRLETGFYHGFNDLTYHSTGTAFNHVTPGPGKSAGMSNANVTLIPTGEWNKDAQFTTPANGKIDLSDGSAGGAFWDNANGDLTGQFDIEFTVQFGSGPVEPFFGVYDASLGTPSNVNVDDGGYAVDTLLFRVRNGKLEKRSNPNPGDFAQEGTSFNYGPGDVINLKRNGSDFLEVWVNGMLKVTSTTALGTGTYRFWAGKKNGGPGPFTIENIGFPIATVAANFRSISLNEFPDVNFNEARLTFVVEEMGTSVAPGSFDNISMFEDASTAVSTVGSNLIEIPFAPGYKVFQYTFDLSGVGGGSGDLEYEISTPASAPEMKVIGVLIEPLQ